MNILDALGSKSISPVRVSRSPRRGTEYASPCPRCGGRDRFRSWPEQGDSGTWWCRQCNIGGDLVKFLMEFDGMGFKKACRALGRELPAYVRKPFQQTFGGQPRHWQPAEARFAPEVNVDAWREHAGKFVDGCHGQLMAASKPLAWLAGRGIDADACRRHRLGYNPGENGRGALFRDRTAWGLPEARKPDGRRKMLWLPRGIVIPHFVDGALVRVRIRRPKADLRPNFDLKYYVVPGSTSAPMLLGADRTAFVVVEAELDAIAVYQAAGDMAGALAVLTSHGKPDAAAHAALSGANAVLVALDADEAGRKGSAFWTATHPAAKRWPVPEGKDPGDAVRAGVDLRAWVLAGLPPVYRVAPAVKTPADAEPCQPVADAMPETQESPAPQAEPDLPAGIKALYQLLAKHPVRIIARSDRTAIVPHPNWRNLDVIGEISKLLFFDPEVLDYVTYHPADELHRGNFWMRETA